MGPDLDRPDPFLPHPSEPRACEATHPKGEEMSAKSTYAKFVLLMLVVIALAMVLGGDPWGPI